MTIVLKEETIHQALLEQAEGNQSSDNAGWTKRFIADLKAQACLSVCLAGWLSVWLAGFACVRVCVLSSEADLRTYPGYVMTHGTGSVTHTHARITHPSNSSNSSNFIEFVEFVEFMTTQRRRGAISKVEQWPLNAHFPSRRKLCQWERLECDEFESFIELL